MQNAEIYNAYAQTNYQTYKTKRRTNKPTKLTKEKLATKRGNKPQAPLSSEQKSQAQGVW